jgi:type II pantothenate kinase
MIGGGTLLGLANLLTGVKDFDTINGLAANGQHGEVDMLIKDIYGDKTPYKELQGDLLASSFAKVAFDNTLDGKLKANLVNDGKYKKEDILSSLVFMISFNIGQLAYMSSRIHQTDKIYFIGNFVKGHVNIMDRINFSINFMS